MQLYYFNVLLSLSKTARKDASRIMENILHDLYYGRINEQKRRPPHAPEYTEVNLKIEDEKRYFNQKMSMEDYERFESLETLYAESSEYEQFGAFSHGFKLGLMLACAAFMDESWTLY